MFGKQLKNLRKESKLTQKEFAQAINVAVGTVGMWEIGKREPDFKTATRIADYFGVSTDYLLGRTEEKEEKEPTPVAGDGLATKKLLLIQKIMQMELDTEMIDRLNQVADSVLAKRDE